MNNEANKPASPLVEYKTLTGEILDADKDTLILTACTEHSFVRLHADSLQFYRTEEQIQLLIDALIDCRNLMWPTKEL